MSDDRELLERWRDGDTTAGSALFERHFESLRRFYRSKVAVTEVEDLMQRALLSCLESVASFRGDSSFRTYLFVIARRELYDHIERKARAARREVPDLGVTSIRDGGVTPSMVALAREHHAIIAEAMLQIPVDFQITLELFYWEQLRGPELAEVLGISPTTVRTRLHRAREALRGKLSQLAPTLSTDAATLESTVMGLGRVL